MVPEIVVDIPDEQVRKFRSDLARVHKGKLLYEWPSRKESLGEPWLDLANQIKGLISQFPQRLTFQQVFDIGSDHPAAFELRAFLETRKPKDREFISRTINTLKRFGDFDDVTLEDSNLIANHPRVTNMDFRLFGETSRATVQTIFSK